MKTLFYKAISIFSPTFRVLNRSFFELNKRIDYLEYTLANVQRENYQLSVNAGKNSLRIQEIPVGNETFSFVYNVFNYHDFKEIVKEIIEPNYFTNDQAATYYWGGYNFKEGDVIVDIGANVGMFSIPFAKAFPNVRVLCFEPIKQNFEQLQKNIALNAVSNVEAFCLGISYEDTSTHFIWKPFHNGGSGGINEATNGSYLYEFVEGFGEVVSVDLIAFDSLFDRYKFNKIALLKMDCEGGEYDIALKSKLFNSDRIDQIIGEVHADGKGGTSFNALNSLLQSHFAGKFRFDCYRDLVEKYGH